MENKEVEKIELYGWCDRYSKITDEKQKEDYIKGILKRDYVPFAEKMLMCNKISQKSFAVNEDLVGYVDMNINEINFVGMVIVLYTNLQFSYTEEGKVEMFKSYEALKESKAINGIIYAIGDDIDELVSVNKRCVDSLVQEQCSLPAYFSRVLKKLVNVDEIVNALKSAGVDINK